MIICWHICCPGKGFFTGTGVEFHSLSEFTGYLKALLSQSYEEFDQFCHKLIDYNDVLDVRFESWLLSLGKRREIEQWRLNLHE